MDNGHIDLSVIVLLSLGGVAVYIAYRRPQLGAAILVGTGVAGLLYVLLFGTGSGHAAPTTPQAPITSAPVSTPAVTHRM